MQRLICILMFAAVWCTSLRADIPAEVIDVLKKCDKAMEHPDGVAIEMKGKVEMVLLTMRMDITTFTKGDKSLVRMTTAMLDEKVEAIAGCDGEMSWEYTSQSGASDTLIISRQPKEARSEYGPDFDLYEEYENAKMKKKDGRYEITFTKPKTKDTPKKTVMVIDARTYYVVSMMMKEGVATVNMAFSNTRIGGIDDSIFVFDRNAFPNAVVIEK